MVMTPAPMILQKYFTLKPVARWWRNTDDFFKIMGAIAAGVAITFLFVMFIVEQNGVANCQKHYGQAYSYDTNASGDNAAKKCVNKATGERKPVVVEK